MFDFCIAYKIYNETREKTHFIFIKKIINHLYIIFLTLGDKKNSPHTIKNQTSIN